MLYPDVFKGIVPTEHIMQEAYWGKAFTAADLAQMADNGQRWAFIIGGGLCSVVVCSTHRDMERHPRFQDPPHRGARHGS